MTSNVKIATARLALLAFVAALAGCERGPATPSTAASTAPVTSSHPSPTPSPRPSPAPSPSPPPSGGWLHVACPGAAPGAAPSALTDVVATFALDPVTGLPSGQILTDLPASFGLDGIAADASRSLVFATGYGDAVGLTRPGRVLPILMASGVPTPAPALDMGSVQMQFVQPWSPAVDVIHGLLFTTSKLTTVPNGPVTQGPTLSFSYDRTGSLTLVQPATPPPVFPQAYPDSCLAVDPTGAFVYSPLSYDPNLGAPGIGFLQTLANQGGKLSPVNTTTQGGASCVAVHPSGRFVFSGYGDGTLNSWSADSSGVLSNPLPVAAVTLHGQTYAVTSIAVHPGGELLLAACCSLGPAPVALVVSLAIDPTTGALTPVGTPTTFRSSPYLAIDAGALAMGRDGKFAYVSLTDPSGTGGSVGVLSIGSGGVLTEVAGSPCVLAVGGRSPLGLARSD